MPECRADRDIGQSLVLFENELIHCSVYMLKKNSKGYVTSFFTNKLLRNGQEVTISKLEVVKTDGVIFTINYLAKHLNR